MLYKVIVLIINSIYDVNLSKHLIYSRIIDIILQFK